MKWSYGITAATAVLMVGALPGGIAKAADTAVQSNAAAFDARADSAASSYCLDMPAVLVGQQICGGFLRSTVTATTDPRGFALGGLAPVPKLSSVPLLIPQSFQGIPVPEQVQAGLKQIKFTNVPSQCQAAFPVVEEGENDQTCGGPTYGDTALGFIGSGANAHVYSTGDEADPTQTRTLADSRAAVANLIGLQTTYDNARALSESGLNEDGNPMGEARSNVGRVAFLSGAFVIEDVVSWTRVAFNGTKQGAAVSTVFKYGGATFAGVPVEITPDGLTVATDQVPADQVKALTAQLNTALENANGFGVKLLPAPPAEIDNSQARATSGGIQVTYRGSTGTDVVYTQTIGVTFAQVSAVPLTSSADLATAAGGESTGAAGSSAAAGANGLADLAASVLPSTSAIGGVAPGQVPSGTLPTVDLRRQVGDQALLANFPSVQPLSTSRMQAIYPAFCVLLLAAFVLARFRRRPWGAPAG